MNSRSIIVERIVEERCGKNQTVGVFVGKLHGGKIVAGWSRARLDLGDKFDMQKGIECAIKNGQNGKSPIYRGSLISVCDKYEVFKNRCLRYFKGFDFNGRTTVNYSKAIEANKRNGVKQEKTTNVPEDTMGAFIRTQLNGMGIEGQSIEDFVRYGVPVIKQLAMRGVRGIALPFNSDGSMPAKSDLSNAIASMAMGMLASKPVVYPMDLMDSQAQTCSKASKANSNLKPNKSEYFRDDFGRFAKLPF